MRRWSKKQFTSPIVGRIVDWAELLGIVAAIISWTGLVTWAASSIRAVAEQGWGAVLFVVIGITCLVGLTARALLPILIYFRPPPLPPQTSQSTMTIAQETQPRSSATIDTRIYIPLLHLLHIEKKQLSEIIIERWIERAPPLYTVENLNADAIAKQSTEFEMFCAGSERDMYHIGIGQDYTSVLRNTEAGADAELHATKVPDGLPPFNFRQWFIGRAKVRQSLMFLQSKRIEFENMIVGDIRNLAEQEQNLRDRRG